MKQVCDCLQRTGNHWLLDGVYSTVAAGDGSVFVVNDSVELLSGFMATK